MDIGSLQDSTASGSSARPERVQQDPPRPAPPEREPEPQAREPSAEVRISREARDLNERARAAHAQDRRQEQARAEQQAADKQVAPRPSVIAVRLGVGPSPLEQQHRQLEPDDVVRQALNERALLPRLDGLLDQATPDQAPPVRLPGQGLAPERAPLPGQKDDPVAAKEREFKPANSSAEAFASRDPGARDRAAAAVLGQSEQPSADRLAGPEDMHRATAVAPQVGLSTGTEEARRPELLGAEREARRDDSRASARDALTGSGEVEATGADEIITRFLGSHQGEDRESEQKSEQPEVGLGKPGDDEKA